MAEATENDPLAAMMSPTGTPATPANGENSENVLTTRGDLSTRTGQNTPVSSADVGRKQLELNGLIAKLKELNLPIPVGAEFAGGQMVYDGDVNSLNSVSNQVDSASMAAGAELLQAKAGGAILDAATTAAAIGAVERGVARGDMDPNAPEAQLARLFKGMLGNGQDMSFGNLGGVDNGLGGQGLANALIGLAAGPAPRR